MTNRAGPACLNELRYGGLGWRPLLGCGPPDWAGLRHPDVARWLVGGTDASLRRRRAADGRGEALTLLGFEESAAVVLAGLSEHRDPPTSIETQTFCVPQLWGGRGNALAKHLQLTIARQIGLLPVLCSMAEDNARSINGLARLFPDVAPVLVWEDRRGVRRYHVRLDQPPAEGTCLDAAEEDALAALLARLPATARWRRLAAQGRLLR